MKKKNIILLLTGLLFALGLLPHVAVCQDSEIARKQFREFYEPLLPRLQASYSNVRFVVARTSPMQRETRITYFRGALQGVVYVYDEFPQFWLMQSQPDPKTLLENYNENQTPENSGGWNPDYAFNISYRRAEKKLFVDHDDDLINFYFDVNILTPMASLHSEATYASIMTSNDFELLEFLDRKQRDGKRVKTLFYRPVGHADSKVFEADFDPETGVCVSSVEFDDHSGRPLIISVTYGEANPNDELLPPPVKISSNYVVSDDETLVLKYERAGELSPAELSVEAYGFDASDALPGGLFGERTMSGATSLLTRIALVMICLLVFTVVCLFLIVLLIRKHGPAPPASEPGPSSDLSE